MRYPIIIKKQQNITAVPNVQGVLHIRLITLTKIPLVALRLIWAAETRFLLLFSTFSWTSWVVTRSKVQTPHLWAITLKNIPSKSMNIFALYETSIEKGPDGNQNFSNYLNKIFFLIFSPKNKAPSILILNFFNTKFF